MFRRKEPNDIIRDQNGNPCAIVLQGSLKKQSKEAKKLLLEQQKRWNEAIVDLMIKYGEPQ